MRKIGFHGGRNAIEITYFVLETKPGKNSLGNSYFILKNGWINLNITFPQPLKII